MTTRTEYLASAAILWVAIWIATALVLDESGFDEMVPILGGGTVFSVVTAGDALPPVATVTGEAGVSEPDERGPSTDGRAFQCADARAMSGRRSSIGEPAVREAPSVALSCCRRG